MTLLGYRNPARRIVGAVRGVLRRPRGSAKRRPLAVVGHRGAARVAAENTLDSFAKAIDLGADAIETDVCVTRDGHFVLWHDCRPDDKVALFRQTGEEGYFYEPDVPAIGSPWRRPVNELDLENLRRHSGYVPCEGNGKREARIPIALLEDLLEWMGSEPRLALVCLDVKLVLAARDAGRIDSVIVWTINDEKRLRELVELNVDGILTDDARLLRRIVSERSPPA